MAFCNAVKADAKKLLHLLTAEVVDHINVSLQIATAIQNFVNSPLSDVVTAIIPGTLDDTIKAKMVPILQKVVPLLSIMKTCKDQTTFAGLMNCFITNLKTQDPTLQEAIIQKLASLITKELHGSQLKQNVYDLFTQLIFSVNKAS